MDDYTIKFFREHYIEHRGISGSDKELVGEAFMGGAHTVILMVTNFLSTPNPQPELRRLAQELNEYMILKSAEAEADRAGTTIH